MSSVRRPDDSNISGIYHGKLLSGIHWNKRRSPHDNFVSVWFYDASNCLESKTWGLGVINLVSDLALVVTCGDKLTVESPVSISGWGEEGTQTVLIGDVKQIEIGRDGKIQFGICICENGEIIITDYDSMCWKTNVPQNVRFKPDRPWPVEGGDRLDA